MKHLLDFIKDNNGVFYFDKAANCFVLAKDLDVQLVPDTLHCAFEGTDDSDEVPVKVEQEWIEPAILSLERFDELCI